MNQEISTGILITAGITAYNAANTIERAVQSALAQMWRPLEIVIVDDASTDQTPVVLERLAGQHPEIRVFRNPHNSGVAATRNRILEEARGVFAAFFDDDDISLPDRITQQHRRICDYERKYAAGQPVICHTARVQQFPDGTERYIHTMGEREGRIAPHGKAVAERILTGAPLEDGYGSCATCSQMARLATYQLLGGFDTSLRRAEDTDLNIRLAVKGGHFAGISQPLVIQKMSRTEDKNLGKEFNNTLLLYERHRDLFSQPGQYDFCLAWLGIKYAFLGRQWAYLVSSAISVFLKHPVWTLQRLWLAVPNLVSNRKLGHFYTQDGNN